MDENSNLSKVVVERTLGHIADHDAIIEQTEHTTIKANLISGRIVIETSFERHGGSPEAAIAEALWVLRDGRIRDGRISTTNAALLGAASMIDRAIAKEQGQPI